MVVASRSWPPHLFDLPGLSPSLLQFDTKCYLKFKSRSMARPLRDEAWAAEGSPGFLCGSLLGCPSRAALCSWSSPQADSSWTLRHKSKIGHGGPLHRHIMSSLLKRLFDPRYVCRGNGWKGFPGQTVKWAEPGGGLIVRQPKPIRIRLGLCSHLLITGLLVWL